MISIGIFWIPDRPTPSFPLELENTKQSFVYKWMKIPCCLVMELKLFIDNDL
jgi:hypothetical protein